MKPILFCDFDGTICHDRYWRSLPIDLYQEVQQFLFGEDRTLVNNWMRGEHTAEEVNVLLAEHLSYSYEDLWNLFVSDCASMRVERPLLDLLSALRERFTVILATGNMDSFTRFTVPSLQLDRYVDHISNSYYERQHKTDDGGALFLHYSRAYGIPIAECILIDDSPKVCDVFQTLGGTALRVTKEHSAQDHFAVL